MTAREILSALPTTIPHYGEDLEVPKVELERMLEAYGLEGVIALLSTIAEEKGWSRDTDQLDSLNLEN
ncbi:MAG: hypothetical protein ACO3YX_08020 [Candidatus Nanopelagicaceae bacterium]